MRGAGGWGRVRRGTHTYDGCAVQAAHCNVRHPRRREIDHSRLQHIISREPQPQLPIEIAPPRVQYTA